MTTNIYRVQAYVSVMFGCYFTGFIDFITKVSYITVIHSLLINMKKWQNNAEIFSIARRDWGIRHIDRSRGCAGILTCVY